MKKYCLYDEDGGFFATTICEKVADKTVRNGGSHHLCEITYKKCDKCGAPTRKIGHEMAECVQCQSSYIISRYVAQQTGINEYSVFENGHCRFHLFKSSNDMWILTTGEHVDVQESLDVLCTRNSIRLSKDDGLQEDLSESEERTECASRI